MPPPSQGSRQLAALQKLQQDGGATGRMSASMVAPVQRSPSGSYADGSGGKTRQPSLSTLEQEVIAAVRDEDVDYGFSAIPTPPPTSCDRFPRGSPPASPPPQRGVRGSSHQAASAPPFQTPPASLLRPSPEGGSRTSELMRDSKGSTDAHETGLLDGIVRTPTPKAKRQLNLPESPPQVGLSAIRGASSRAFNEPWRDNQVWPSTVPTMNTKSTTSTTSPRLKALEHSFVSSPRSQPVPPPVSFTERGYDQRFISAYQVPRQQLSGAFGHLPQVGPVTREASFRPSQTGPQTRVPPKPLLPDRYHDRSGFRNAGNTCYAASVLTALLRQPLFCRALKAFVETHGKLNITVEEDRIEEVAVSESTTTDAAGASDLRAGLFDDVDAYDDAASPKDHAEFQKFFAVQPIEPPGVSSSVGDPSGSNEETQEVVVPTTSIVVRERRRVPMCPLHLALHEAALKLESPQSIRHGVSVDGIAHAMENYEAFGQFFDGDQHDAHEFYVGLISCIEQEALEAMRKLEKRKRRQTHKALKRLRTDPDGGEETAGVEGVNGESAIKASDVWVNKLLQGAMHVIVACRRRHCGIQQVTREPFINLSLPMEAAPPLVAGETNAQPHRTPRTTATAEAKCAPGTEDLVAASLCADALDGYKCDRCGQSTLQFHAGNFHIAPPLLAVQWKRFTASFTDGVYSVRKNSNPVTVSKSFTIVSRPEAYLTALGTPHTMVRRTTYELRAVVMHQGVSLHGGHYLTLFRSTHSNVQGHGVEPTGDSLPAGTKSEEGPVWMLANDTEVKEVTTHQYRLATEPTSLCYLGLYENTGSIHEADIDCDGRRSWVVQFPELQDDPPKEPPKGECTELQQCSVPRAPSSQRTLPTEIEGPEQQEAVESDTNASRGGSVGSNRASRGSSLGSNLTEDSIEHIFD